MSLIEKTREIVWKESGDTNSIPWNFIVNGVLSTHLLPNRVRTQLLRLMGLKLHPKTIVRPKSVLQVEQYNRRRLHCHRLPNSFRHPTAISYR